MTKTLARFLLLLPAALGGLSSASAQEVMVTGRVVVVHETAAGRTADYSNAVVWLTPLSGENPDPRPVAAGGPRLRLIQKHKHFVPHVLVVPVGSAVDFPNLDPFFHNVFSLFEGKRFDLGLYEAGATRLVRFDRPGICYIFCNIHPEMSGAVVVLATPYYAVSGRDGATMIPNVPGGRYRLEVWYERSLPQDLRALSREVTISGDARSLGTIRVSESGNVAVGHKNKYDRDYDPPTPSSPLYEQQ